MKKDEEKQDGCKYLPTIDEIRVAAADVLFGSPLVENLNRGLIAETLVGLALDPQWKHFGQDCYGWDFEHLSGCRLEVKQTSVVQTWDRYSPATKARKPCFGIAPSKGYYIGNRWTPKPGRKADIYVFAFHVEADLEKADHRDPAQWRFYALATDVLPNTTTITPAKADSLSQGKSLAWQQLSDEVESVRLNLKWLRCGDEGRKDPIQSDLGF